MNVILPLVFMLSLGYILKRIKLLDEHTTEGMNGICFRAFFPLLLFNSIYKTDLSSAFNPKLMLFAVGALLLLFLLLCVIIPIVEKDNKRRGVLIQGIFRSNFVIFGLPISIALCGEENVGPTSLLIAIIVPMYNALSIVALEIYKGDKVNVKRILKGVITNPLVIGGIAGILALLLHIRFPSAIEGFIGDIAKITTPLALILLGGSFKFSDIRSNIRPITLGVFAKLILIPLIFVPICILVGFRDVELVSLVVMIGAPAAVSTYTMAGQMDADQTLAGQLVVIGSIVSVVTMFLWIFILKQMGMF